MKIPKQFKFAGITFTVEIVDDIHNEDDSYDYGQFDSNTNIIKIARTIYGDEVSEQTMLNTYFHELAHAINYYYNNGSDESFAQSVGNLLMEYSQTVLYEERQDK